VVSESKITCLRDGGVATVILDAPARRNAITYAMREQLSDCLQELDRDSEINVAIITGAGKAFCSGTDLSDGGAPPAGALHTIKPLTAALDEFSKPLIVAINGPAVGGGFEIALAADMRIASTAAWFALPEVRIGSLPGSGGTQRLARALPPALAAELIFTGNRLSAEDALRYGLISSLAEPDELVPRAQAIAAQVCEHAPLAVRAAKLALKAALEHPMTEGRALERALWAMLANTEDRAEGRAAFREGRKPEFKGS
jgi:enoyl-CoA hydratase/carnithine racemase